MSDTSDHSGKPFEDLPEDELLAAEYALGVLTGTDRAAAQRLLQRDRNFARMVAEWEQRLAPWAGEIVEVSPPPQVWEAIAAALPAAAPPSAGIWQSLAFWRGFALASALAAACLGGLIYLGAVKDAPPLIATIEGGGARVFVATIDARRGTVSVVPASYSADPTRALGLLRADRTVTIAIPPEFASQTVGNATLAVSLEPPGGSPTGAPTGPVIGAGKLTSL